MSEASTTIRINRAPVLTLCRADALGRRRRGECTRQRVSLGIFEPEPELVRERGDPSQVKR